MPLSRPKRKNPVLRTPAPTVPPAARSRVALGLTAAAALGRFELQVCRDCAAVQYPPREVCGRCLSPRLAWRVQTGEGELIAHTRIHHSNDLYFRERLPWRLGFVKLDSGPSVMVHLHADVTSPPTRVRVAAQLDRAGQGVLLAFPPGDSPNMMDDRQLREMTSDPEHRKILVSDGKTAVGQAIVKACVAAGAELVWVGYAEPWKQAPGFAELAALPAVSLVPLDLTDSKSVSALAAEIGGKVDIVISNADYHRAFDIGARRGTETARMEMEVNYFGLLRLAQEFGPALRARAVDGQANATAWVNLLSIYSLASFPSHATYSASKAAAFSLSQCLRADMARAGIRVVNVFPGPIDDEWNQLLPPPKLAPSALAAAIMKGLREGVEDLYPGDVAQDWFERWRENPKVLERELSL